LTRIRNVRNTTKFKRSIKAISPVIATLLMIAIAVVASLVVYAWVTGYIGGSTTKAGKAIQIPSFALDDAGKLHVYVQNVGQGTTQLSAVYVNDALVASPNDQIPEGNTVELVINGPYSENTKLNIKVTTTDGTFMTTTGTGTNTNPVVGNQAPVGVADSYSATTATLLTVSAPGVLSNDNDPNGDTLSAVQFSALSNPSAGTLTTNANGGFTFTSAAGFTGSVTFTYKASDGSLTSAATTVTITVSAANQAPVLASIGNKNVNELSTLTFTATATDPDSGQTLTYSLDTGFPGGATINTNSGIFSWTPTEAQGPGSYQITVRVTDNGSPAKNDFETITVTVNEIHPQTIFTDAFPQGNLDTTKWTSSGSVSISNTSPHQTGDYYVGLASSGSSITSTSISATNYKTITVSYYRNTDSGVTLTVQWRIGSGTWTTLETVPSNTGWPANPVSFSLGSNADGQAIQLMFTASGSRARIDDVVVQGIPLS
jgi:flagellin-like protein